VVVLVAALFALSRLALDDDPAPRAGDVRALPRAPVSAPPPTAAAKGGRERGAGAEAEEQGAVQLPFRQPGTYPLGSPERAVAAFVSAWRDRHWTRMATWTALAWRRNVDQAADWLAGRFGARRPHGYLIQTRLRRPGEARYRVLVEYRALRPPLRRDTFALTVLRPSQQELRTDAGLRWGVDPQSVRVVSTAGGSAGS